MADLFEGTEVSLDEMLGCARREVKMREQVYPRWVAGKKMTQDKADQELRAMRAIVAFLEKSTVVRRLAAAQRHG